MMKKKSVLILIVVFCIIVFLLIYGNKALQTNHYIIESEKLPVSFDSFTIVQVSDLHNTQITSDNKKLISQIRSATPDIIVITGDLIDSRKTNVDTAVDFMQKAVQIAPCYYVSGNHEARVPLEYKDLKDRLSEINVTFLENTSVKLYKNDEYITLAGINDPLFLADNSGYDLTKTLIENVKCDESFSVLLSHRPELFDVYVENNYDLVFSGHAHGGQIRLPFIGGILSPHQGFFPEYDCGLYTENNTNMIVSRGIGNSIFPLRINNRPEIIVAQLKSK